MKTLAGMVALVIIFFTCTFDQCVFWQDGEYLVFDSMTVAAGDDVAITVKPLFKVATDGGADAGDRMVISILVPKLWNLRGNATMSYENTAVEPGVIRPMFLISDEISPKQDQWQGMTWGQALMKKFGVGLNVPGSDMEWVTFWSDPYDMHNLDARPVNVFIKFKTSVDNVKCKLGFFVNNSNDGISDNTWYSQITFMDEPFETVGAPGGVIDFCEEHPNSESPMFVTKDDIVTIKYSSAVKTVNLQGDTVNTALYGAANVYLCASAYTASGGKYDVIEPSEKTQMIKESDTNFSLTFWPADYFGIPDEEEISRVEYYFVNAEQSLYVKNLNDDGSESPFVYFFDCR